MAVAQRGADERTMLGAGFRQDVPVLAQEVTERLGLVLEFMSYPQETELGREMREWIVEAIKPIEHEKIHRRTK